MSTGPRTNQEYLDVFFKETSAKDRFLGIVGCVGPLFDRRFLRFLAGFGQVGLAGQA